MPKVPNSVIKVSPGPVRRVLLTAAVMAIASMAALPAQASLLSVKSAARGTSLGRWHVNKLPAAWHGSAPAKVTPGAVCSDPNVMYNLNSGKVAEVYHSGKANYNNVDQWAADGTATQQWCFYYEGSDSGDIPVYELINNNSGKCMDVYHSHTANGTNVDQYTCNGTEAQEWAVINSTVAYSFFPQFDFDDQGARHLADVLEVYHSGKANGDNVDIWKNNASHTQQWCPGSCS